MKRSFGVAAIGGLILAFFATAVAPAATAGSAAAVKEYVLKHPKREHCKSHYVKKAKTVHKRVHGHTVAVHETVCVHSAPTTTPHPSPVTNSAKLEECTAKVGGTGLNPETHLYSYQVILACGKGEFGSFQVSTNRMIAAGSVTAQIGSTHTYTCTLASSTSFSCSGVNAAIPPQEGSAIRAFFKSAQPPCEGSSPESATIVSQGQTFAAAIGEVQGSC
jgi:hypothetical protein